MVKPASGNQPCPDGYVLRKGYTRKLKQNVLNKGYTVQRKGQFYTAKPTKNTVDVPASCVKKKSNSGMGVLRKGTLIKYGYSFKLADRQREKALIHAMEAYGKTSVVNRLATVAKLAKASQPNVAAIFMRDREWAQQQPDPKK
jgi:hypothetical protein